MDLNVTWGGDSRFFHAEADLTLRGLPPGSAAIPNSTEDPRDAGLRIPLDLMFPDSKHQPLLSAQPSEVAQVAASISLRGC